MDHGGRKAPFHMETMMAKSTNERLVETMEEYRLTRRQVAELTESGGKSTVDRWLLPRVREDGTPNPGWRRMPEARMTLLKIGVRRLKKKFDRGVDRADNVSHDSSTV